MQQLNVRNSLRADLEALPKRRLLKLLESLSGEERKQVAEVLAPDTSARVPFPALVALSPWLIERIERAAGFDSSLMTDATRSALMELVDGLPAKQTRQPTPAAGRPSFIARFISRQGDEKQVA